MVVINNLGLHARAAAQLVKLAGEYESKISIENRRLKISADARSILCLLTLSGSAGSTLYVNVSGEDEKSAIDAVVALFKKGFGEL